MISANLTSLTLKVTPVPADPGEGRCAIFGLQLGPGRQATLTVYQSGILQKKKQVRNSIFCLSMLYFCLAEDCHSPVLLLSLLLCRGFSVSGTVGTYARVTENKYLQYSLSCKHFPLVHLSEKLKK